MIKCLLSFSLSVVLANNTNTKYRRRKKRRLFFSLSGFVCARVSVFFQSARSLLKKMKWFFLSRMYLFFPSLFEEEKKKKISSSRNLFFYQKHHPKWRGFTLFCQSVFLTGAKVFLWEEANLSARKKTRKAETTNTPAQYHSSSSSSYSFYKFIFTTKRKESTDNNKNNNKNKNKNNTLNCSNATSVTFRNSVVVFFSKRDVVQLQRQKREQF